MEIKTCEEYVLNELKTLQEKLTKVNEENEILKATQASVKRKEEALNKILSKLYLQTNMQDVLERMCDIEVSIMEEPNFDPLRENLRGLIKFRIKRGVD
jgi:hypothetical protein